jgi:hypothetical protein
VSGRHHAARDHTHALFAGRRHLFPDNVLALSRPARAQNCSAVPPLSLSYRTTASYRGSTTLPKTRGTLGNEFKEDPPTWIPLPHSAQAMTRSGTITVPFVSGDRSRAQAMVWAVTRTSSCSRISRCGTE